MSSSLRRTVLHGFHVAKKARMGAFAGYDMPIQYPLGALQEHLHTRNSAGLFDLSHVGCIELRGPDREKFFEWITPCGIAEMKEGQAVLTLLLNHEGGVKDDCIVCKYPDHLFCVVNAGCKEKDIAHVRSSLEEFKGNTTVVEVDCAVVSLQGPKSAEVLAPFVEDLDKLLFMRSRLNVSFKGIPITLTRCGYSGEDGFDLVMQPKDAESIVELLLQDPKVQLAGLGARDTLRLEAGLSLYGHEIDEDINPVAARLMWCIPKRRMAEGGFIGHESVKKYQQSPELVRRLRVGIRSVERGPVPRAGMPIVVGGEAVGHVSSGAPSPSLGCNIAMGFVDREKSKIGQKVEIDVRGRRVPGEVVQARFVPLRYYKG
ncbi:putative glycine synthase [Trypanosoma theileri]|uniref:Aminomethyltransferase n=1 Tax=Trypanosoma theileri TaxID=67003 RepID=A0A1X0P476_9TRYP|nr:putative glycine synthase [Trypanosoma theileri]ORC91463.1 putative glycine synthase [Trypanosoma theileri]